MLLNYSQSFFDEFSGTNLWKSDSFSRSSLFKIQSNFTSFGRFDAGDRTDYFSITPGVGDFELFVTTDPANGVPTGFTNLDFEIKITDIFGNTILNSVNGDFTTEVIRFQSSSFETYYVEITNTFFKSFIYAAALRPVFATPATPFIDGTQGADTLIGTTASEEIFGLGGYDSISAGGGNDTVIGGEGQSYIRGDDGNDLLVGGSIFDDINGNAGNDTVQTGAGEDYCVGGKDNDSLSGGADYDLVYGNLGNDTCFGDDGDDIVRGGQGNDVVNGGNGADYVSGDKGDDTMTGGAGADIFHSFGDAGIDRVTDFNLAQGDRVQLDPGTVFTVSQSGADTVINMTGGGQMILVGVQMSTLTGSWIFGA